VDDRDDDVAMATVPSGPAGRRGGVSAEVFSEEDAKCYVKKVKFSRNASAVFIFRTFRKPSDLE